MTSPPWTHIMGSRTSCRCEDVHPWGAWPLTSQSFEKGSTHWAGSWWARCGATRQKSWDSQGGGRDELGQDRVPRGSTTLPVLRTRVRVSCSKKPESGYSCDCVCFLGSATSSGFFQFICQVPRKQEPRHFAVPCSLKQSSQHTTQARPL